MNSTSIEIIVGFCTFIVSVSVSAFVSGTRWGRMESDVRLIADRLAKIEGMFELRLRNVDDADQAIYRGRQRER